MSDLPLRVEHDGPLWHVTLDRPDHGNAMSAAMVRALDEVLDHAEQAQAGALVLRGAGRHFCTGFDLSDIEQESDDTLLARFVRIELLLQRVARAPFATIAVAHGRVMGVGADLFSACALRLVHGDARFSFPGAKGFGLVLGTRRLAACVGAAQAEAWVRHAEVFDERAALRSGLVHAAPGAQPQAIEAAIAQVLGFDTTCGRALRAAVEPDAARHDAQDLALLVRSAARSGLKDRIAAYVQRNAAARARPATPPH